MKLAFFDAKEYDKESFTAPAREAGIDIHYYDTKLDRDTVSLACGYDAVCVFVNDTVNADVIDALADCGIRMIALRCAGFNNVDIKHAEERGIAVARVPAYSPHAVAEHAMAMLLTSVRRTHKAYIRTKDFNFSLRGLTGFDLHGKTVGIVGTGRIGRVFADICRGFGMRVLGYDKYPDASSGLEYVSLEKLFSTCDIISFHCPLTRESYHMVDADSIAYMKRGVILINTSRGALIDAEALLAGIKSRHIGAACLDVYEEESDLFFEDRSGHIVEDDILARLISMPNVLLTSHQAFLTAEALRNIADTTVQNLLSLQQGADCENAVCTPAGSI